MGLILNHFNQSSVTILKKMLEKLFLARTYVKSGYKYFEGRTVAQPPAFHRGAWVRSHGSPYGIRGGQSVTGPGFFSEFFAVSIIPQLIHIYSCTG